MEGELSLSQTTQYIPQILISNQKLCTQSKESQFLLKINFYYCATNFKPGYLNSNLGFCQPKAHSAKPILREKSFSWMLILTMFISHVTLTFSCSCNFFTKTVLPITTLDRRNTSNGSPEVHNWFWTVCKEGNKLALFFGQGSWCMCSTATAADDHRNC